MNKYFSTMLLAACAALFVNAQNIKHDNSEWQLVWEDEFENDDSFDTYSLDTSRWSMIPRGRADWNRNMSDYGPLYALRDGKIILRGIANDCLPEDSMPYLTGGIYTKDKVSFGRGRLEVCAKLQGAQGAWPAIWLMPQSPAERWPDCGEIDIMERLSHDDIAYQTVHSSYTLNEGNTHNPRSSATGAINPADFNIYAVELYQDSVVFYINDLRTITYPRLIPEVPGQFPFDTEWYLMIDMQLGGKWVGEVDSAQLPVEMEIDWVRFYRRE